MFLFVVGFCSLSTILLYVCACAYVTGHRFGEYAQIMRWWSSNIGQKPLRNLGSVNYCYIAILDPLRPLLPSSDVFPGGVSPLLLQHPLHRLLSCLHTGLSTQPGVTYLRPRIPKIPCLSLTCLCQSPPPPPTPPRLPDSSFRCSLTAAEISSNMTLRFFYAAACLHQGSRIFPPHL